MIDSSFFCNNKKFSLPFSLSKNLLFIKENIQKCINEDVLSESEKLVLEKNAHRFFKQFIPSEQEFCVSEDDLEDPLGAKNYHVLPRLIHQYKNRCLLLTHFKCFYYCRYCFRKTKLLENQDDFISDADIDAVCEYLRNHSEIEEILLSGGDPLLIGNEKFEQLLIKLRETKKDLLIRICTRSLTFAPERFDDKLISILSNNKPLWIIPHINHPFEIDMKINPKTVALIEKLGNCGLPLQSQTVLLSGVNDSLEDLTTLFNKITKLGIKPGYLFQCDLARGTSHFRVPLVKGLELYDTLKKELSGLSLPVYAVDLPGGGGKIHLETFDILKNNPKITENDTMFVIETAAGKKYFYPKN